MAKTISRGISRRNEGAQQVPDENFVGPQQSGQEATRPETAAETKDRHVAEDKEDEEFQKNMMTMSKAFGDSKPNMQGGRATYKATAASLSPTVINNPFFK